MKISDRAKEIHFWIARDVQLFAIQCREQSKILDEEAYVRFYKYKVGTIANAFFGKADVQISKITQTASELKRTDCTFEHIMSRGRSAARILNKVIKNPNVSFERVVNEVVCSCRVVMTTKKENFALEKIRKKWLEAGNKRIPWRLMYNQLGLTLIDRDPNVYRKYYYVIEQIRYESAQSAAEQYGITAAEVDSRALNKKTYLDWGKYSIETNEQVYRKSYEYEKKQKKSKDSQKYVYFIDGVKYNDIKEAMTSHEVSYGVLISRCNSKTKWPNWQRIKKEVL